MFKISNDIFITRVWCYEMTDLKRHHELWTSNIEQMRSSSEGSQGRSNRGGWNSAMTLFENQLFKPLRAAAQAAFSEVLKSYNLEKSLRFKLLAWANITDPGGYNVTHGHPHCLMSACYYLTVPELSGDIAFEDPRPAAKYAPLKSGKSLLGSRTVTIRPKSGDLLVFPSWLEHYVEQNGSENPRVSIAMNAVEV
jgi:uncharacterized protein (TIGR02466 family)